MAERLSRKYRVEKEQIVIISQPVPKHISDSSSSAFPPHAIVASQKPIKLLFLAAYYLHKNHAILFSVADELRRRRLTDLVHFFVTLDDAAAESADLRKRLENYSDVITNLGRIPWQQVAATYKAATALFLPTLVESYGIVYLEAMVSGVPILTSDRDFARWICQNLALFFNPLDPVDIVDTILKLPWFDLQNYQAEAKRHLASFPANWDEVAKMYAEVL